MSKEEIIFFIILIINLLTVVAYRVIFHIFVKKNEGGYFTRCLVMLLCPVIGPLYFFLGWLWRKLFFHKPVELVDVLFSKERESSVFKADEEGERNIVPVEDAVTVTDKHSARQLMLEVLKHDVRRTMISISTALNSEDSEISHYAASVLQSELGKFRLNVQNMTTAIDTTEEELREAEDYDGELRTEKGVHFANMLMIREQSENRDLSHESDDEEEEKVRFVYADISPKLEMSEDYQKHTSEAYEQGRRAMYGEEEEFITLGQKLHEQMLFAHKLIDDIICVLDQKVLSDMETEQYSELIDRIGELIEKRDVLSVVEIDLIAMQFLKIKRYDDCLRWCDKQMKYYPDTLEAYSARAKLYFTTDQKEKLFETLVALRATGITLDHEMLEMVRVFM